MKTTDVNTIVREWLTAHGYDGLLSRWDCVCDLDNLFDCDSECGECEPGVKVPCDCGDHDWHMVTKERRDRELKEEDKA